MYVLGIETTCDETAVAVVEKGKKILSNCVYSQVASHREFGGVVPELACRKHVDLLIPLTDQALKEANLTLQEIDLIAVAHTPGLVGALLVGVNAAKGFSFALNKPLVGVNHVAAHLYAPLLERETLPHFPCLGVVLSGGHTAFVEMESICRYTPLAQTVDDAIGEAFDKVGKILGLPYPGGPEIEKLALEGDPATFPFGIGRVKSHPYDLSFSGLKTAVLYQAKGKGANYKSAPTLPKEEYANLAASFQRAAFDAIIDRAKRIVQDRGYSTLLFGGGVTNNQMLRRKVKEELEVECIWPTPSLTLDNAAMIAGLGYYLYQERGADSLDLKVRPTL